MSRRRQSVVLVALMLFFNSIIAVVGAQATEVKITVLAMGDSYTAGTGGLDYYGPSGCYQSRSGYPYRLAEKIRSRGVIKVDFGNVACHGAVVEDLDEQVKMITERERLAVDLVLMTIGGNDGGFSNLIKQCFVPGIRDVIDCATAVVDATNKVPDIQTATFSKLVELSKIMPYAHFVLVGYPYPIDDGPNDCKYVLESSGYRMEVGPAVRELADKLEQAQKLVVEQLNRKYPGRFEFVSVHSYFAGHENCGDKAMWLRGNFDTLIVNEWWHPNKEGYQAIASRLNALKVAQGEEDIFRYGNLPLACGVVVTFASTFDSSPGSVEALNHKYTLDLPMPFGTKVVAPVSGRATVGYNPVLGYYVAIYGSDGVTYRMAHLQQAGLIPMWTEVKKGQKIGLVGRSGTVMGTIIHYEMVKNGRLIPIKLDGPKLEWGPSQGDNNYRRTTHTLESSNTCR